MGPKKQAHCIGKYPGTHLDILDTGYNHRHLLNQKYSKRDVLHNYYIMQTNFEWL